MLHNKFWQGFFAIAPIILGIIAVLGYFIFIFSILSNIEDFESNGNVSTSFIFGNMIWFFVLIILIIFVSLGSLIFYIVHAVQNPNLKENNLLVVWVLLFVFVSGIGQLIYWLVEIVGKRKQLSS
jgi:membrane-bound ClpP family serine protease